jgi:hypothetical protein
MQQEAKHMARHQALFTLTYGLQGCYMPDSHLGPYCVTRRKDLIEAVRDALTFYDVKNAKERLHSIFWRERVWPHIKQHGASSLHFCIPTDEHNMLEFHGLTTAEYNEAGAAQAKENGDTFEPLPE